MPRFVQAALMAAAVLLVPASATRAGDGDPGKYQGYYAYPPPVSGVDYGAGYAGGYAGGPVAPGYGPCPWMGGGMGGPGYPQLNAALYPCPRADIPTEVGGTMITNEAFNPHEMLYCHKYRAVYPPNYYKVRWHWGFRMSCYPAGKWYAIPIPVRTRIADTAKLKGTVVTVKYKSHIGIGSMFLPPTGSEYPLPKN